MLRRSVLAFILICALLGAAALSFVQSEFFAGLVKEVMKSRLPAEFGLGVEFTSFHVHYFPPGISVNKPDVRFLPGGKSGFKETSTLGAESIEFRFYPLQMLGGTLSVSEIRIKKGRMLLDLPKERAKPAAKGKGLEWGDLFGVKVDAFALEDSLARVNWDEGKEFFFGRFRSLRIETSRNRSDPSYLLEFDVSKLESSKFPRNEWFNGENSLEADLRISPSLILVNSMKFGSGVNEISISGRVPGNALEPEGLIADLSVRAKIEGPWIKAALGTPSTIEGLFQVQGKVAGPLKAFPKNLTARLEISGEKARYDSWAVEKLTARALYVKEVITLHELLAESPIVAREGGHKPGSGGKIQIEDARIDLSPDGVSRIPIELEGVHPHWLIGPELKNVYGMDFRANGKVIATVTNGKDGKWSASLDTDLKIPRFQLDNQHLGIDRKLTRILSIPDLSMKGIVEPAPGGVAFRNVTLRLPNSEFSVHGSVSTRTGYALEAEGKVDCADFGILAENVIRGKGTLRASIHGPFSRVILDFFPNLDNAEYLRLKLGRLSGKIVWDEDPSDLLFEGVEARQGRTLLDLSGKVALGKKESIALTAKIRDQGDLSDLFVLASSFHEGLWWFPASMTGQVQGSIEVSGVPDLSGLKVETSLEGRSWALFGERFQRGRMRAGYDSGAYFVHGFDGAKGEGRVTGSVDYGRDGNLEWELKSSGLTLKDFDWVSRLDVPIRGKIAFDSAGSHAGKNLESYTRLAIREIKIRGVPYDDSEAVLEIADQRALFHGTVSNGQAIADLEYPFQPGQEARLKADLKNLDFSPLLLLINPRLIRETQLEGRVSGSLGLSFRAGAVDRASGKISLSDYRIAKPGLAIKLKQPMSAEIRDGSFRIGDLTLMTNDHEARLALRSDRGELDGVIDGSADLSLLSLFVSVIESASGSAKLDGRIRGFLKDPKIFGRATIETGIVRSPSLPSPIENMSGTMRLQQNLIFADGIAGDLASGRATLQGTAKLVPSFYPELALQIGLSNTRLRVYPFQFVKTSGTFKVTGVRPPYLMEGTIRSDSGLIKEKISGSQGGAQRRTTRFPPPPNPWGTDVALFELDVRAISEGGIFVKNDLFDAEMMGDVRIVHTIEAPRIMGEVSVRQGKMLFKDRIFTIESGRAEFDNPAVIDPRFSFLAHTEVEKTNVRLYVQGRKNDIHVDLSSTPALPEAEILSLLAVGYTSGDIQKRKSSDLGYAQQGEAASVLLHSFDFNRDVQERTGLQIEVNEAQDTRTANSIFRPQDASVAGSSPKIVIKRQLGRRLTFSFSSTVGVGNGSEKEANVEVRMTPALSVLGVWNSFEGNSAGTGTTASETQESYGVDLKVQKRFK